MTANFGRFQKGEGLTLTALAQWELKRQTRDMTGCKDNSVSMLVKVWWGKGEVGHGIEQENWGGGSVWWGDRKSNLVGRKEADGAANGGRLEWSSLGCSCDAEVGELPGEKGREGKKAGGVNLCKKFLRAERYEEREKKGGSRDN